MLVTQTFPSTEEECDHLWYQRTLLGNCKFLFLFNYRGSKRVKYFAQIFQFVILLHIKQHLLDNTTGCVIFRITLLKIVKLFNNQHNHDVWKLLLEKLPIRTGRMIIQNSDLFILFESLHSGTKVYENLTCDKNVTYVLCQLLAKCCIICNNKQHIYRYH